MVEERPAIDAVLEAPKSVDNWRNNNGSKQKENDKNLPTEKRSSSTSIDYEQSKNWKVPNGAKLFGYNLQMIAGYIPTSYLSNHSRKDDRRKWELQNSEMSVDSYAEYVPGYNINPIKNYDVNRMSNEPNTVIDPAHLLNNSSTDKLMENKPIAHMNLNPGENKFMRKRAEPNNNNVGSTTVGLANFYDSLWPMMEAEPDDGKEEDENISESEVNHSTAKNTDSTTAEKSNFLNIKDLPEDDPIKLFHSTVENGNARNERENREKPHIIIQQNNNFSMRNRFDEKLLENLTLIPKVVQLRDEMGNGREENPLFKQFTVEKPGMNHIDGQAAAISKELSELSQVIPRRSLPLITPETNVKPLFVQQSTFGKNGTTNDIINWMAQSKEQKRTVEDIKGSSDLHVNDNDEHGKSIRSGEFNGNKRRWSQQRLAEMQSSNEDANKGKKENKYDEADNDVVDNHNDITGDGDDDDIPKENDDEQGNSEEKQEGFRSPIFHPVGIPTFEEWLSNLPIRPVFPFGAKNDMRPSSDSFHLSFLKPFRQVSENEENSQEQYSVADSKKKVRDPLDDDGSEDEDEGHLQHDRFILPRNVPYE